MKERIEAALEKIRPARRADGGEDLGPENRLQLFQAQGRSYREYAPPIRIKGVNFPLRPAP